MIIEQVIALVTHFIINLIQSTGYIGIFLLMAAESALIPIPSEVTMPFAGYLVTLGKFNFLTVVFVGALANLVGSLLAYGLGFWGSETFVRNFITKYGKWFLVSSKEFDHSNKWFRRYGEKIVFLGRILPVVRTYISLPAGVAEMDFWRFSLFTLAGSFIWSYLLTYIGVTLGKNWNSLQIYYRKLELLIIGLIVIGAVYYICNKLKRK